MGVIPIFKKNWNPFVVFPFISTPSKTIKTFFWKSKIKHTGVEITCFFQDAKSSLTKDKKCFWKRLMEPVKHLSCSFLQKKLTGYSRKQFPQKKSTIDVWEDPKEYQPLLWWIVLQILTSRLNIKIWCRIPVPLFNNSPTSPYN